MSARRVAASVPWSACDLVVAETYALLLRRVGFRPALTFARTVGGAPNLVVRSSVELEERAIVDWLERFADQDFSLTDAVSFAVMSERRIAEALTLDHHSAAAGLRPAALAR
jgi:predicted nucleic acid-binding protein